MEGDGGKGAGPRGAAPFGYREQRAELFGSPDPTFLESALRAASFGPLGDSRMTSSANDFVEGRKSNSGLEGGRARFLPEASGRRGP